MNTSTHYTMKQFDPLPQKQQQQQQKTTNKQTKTVKVSPRLPLTPSNHGSLPSKVLYLQGIHNTCSKHKIIQYLRNHTDTADTYGLVIYPKYRTNSLKSLSEAGIIKHKATQHASAFTHTDTHIEGRGKMYYNVAGKE